MFSINNIILINSSILFNDLQDFDLENNDFVKSFEKYVFSFFHHFNNNQFFDKFVKINISDFALDFDLWCDKKEIKKRIYADFLKVLWFLNVADVNKLFNRLSTLNNWCRNQLFLFVIHNAKISVQREKQFIESSQSHVEKIHYLNVKILINIILSFNLQINFHVDMIDIVNNSFEYWHFHNWDSFIRTCDNDFSRYNDNFFIFFFDIIQYFCTEDQYHIKHFFHCDQIVFFERDQRSLSQSCKSVVFKIRLLIFDNFNSNIVFSFCKSAVDEYLLIEDLIEKISFFKIIIRCFDVVISRNKIIVIKFLINNIFNISNERLKSSKLTFFIREELEIQTFDKE
jgi:hypothetical protein